MENDLNFKNEHMDLKGQYWEPTRPIIMEHAPPDLECFRARLKKSGWKVISDMVTSVFGSNMFEEVVNSPILKNL